MATRIVAPGGANTPVDSVTLADGRMVIQFPQRIADKTQLQIVDALRQLLVKAQAGAFEGLMVLTRTASTDPERSQSLTRAGWYTQDNAEAAVYGMAAMMALASSKQGGAA